MSSLIVVSNRLPVTAERTTSGYRLRSSPGGLVSALQPILREVGGCWIGAADYADSELENLLQSAADCEGFTMRSVFVPPALWNDYYNGFCNQVLWPLFHDLQSRCNFSPQYWYAYVEASSHFAKAIVSQTRAGDVVWIHDYHLMHLGTALARHFDPRNLLYFHHVPFPPPDVFEKLPWRKDILKSLLSFGLVGFQTARDRFNFISCVRRILTGCVLKRNGSTLAIKHNSVETLVGTFPIGIDYEDFVRTATNPVVLADTKDIRKHLPDCHVVLGVDRMDYTKGILERIRGFSALLDRYPALHKRIVLIQIAVPSREGVRLYKELKTQVEALIREVNERFEQPGWTPIHYLYRHFSRSELLAFYRAADIALVTPLKDGMNLVCKEFCASRVDDTGVLVLSEFAGAARQLNTGALLVNPYDAEGLAAALYNAVEMNPREVKRRMRRMRQRVSANDVFDWCSRIFDAADVGPVDCLKRAASSVHSATELSYQAAIKAAHRVDRFSESAENY